MLTTEQQQHYRSWLMLAKTPGVGTKTYSLLLEQFGSPDAVFGTSSNDLAAFGLKAKSLNFLKNPDWSLVDTDLKWAEQDIAHILTLDDARYPSLLREIADPPPVLYVYGQISALALNPFAMVGSRNPSSSGTETAFAFAKHLSSMGFSIVSGLALGIDVASHQGALAADGATIAVTGTGLDRVYPAKHKDIAHQITDKGALVSEFAPGTAATAGNFPRRNRIISGLSYGVLVVEAALKSGSLITARLATEQGREVFAVPGSIHHTHAKGCNALIREGAKLVETAQHVLEELQGIGSVMLDNLTQDNCGINETQLKRTCSTQELDEDYVKVLEGIGFEPTSVDKVIIRSGLTADAVCSMLLILELRGYIVPAAGGSYFKV
ncbi:Rossmann fold nucleotide-binding protein Smf possibly involved in DNA uptake [hydrothermal vent metagenome]|uniref:Rossmann fold nucleotide-binding protein Smf possibly involved in DNA uptake n=1 Tax=hydrothermal vent metagenome TaxID=652676 RepID=A0A3B1AKR1_9ZZZZ